MEGNTWVLWVLALVALTVIIFLIRFITWRRAVQQGRHVHNKVDGILKKYGLLRNFKVLRNVTISYGNRSAVAEHVLIGFFGILFLTARGETADFYGERRPGDWLMIQKKKSGDVKHKIENPIQHNEEVMSITRELLGHSGVYNTPMEGLVIFSGRPKKTTIYCADNTVKRLKDLKSYLNKAKFDKDNNLDVPKIEKILLSSSQKN